jgi:hypothetical protein
VLQGWCVPDLAVTAAEERIPAEEAMRVMLVLAWRLAVQEQLFAGATQDENESETAFYNRLAASESGQVHAQRINRELCETFRELFGNPFRPVELGNLLVHQELRQLAQGIYQQNHFQALPILADALEEAGCTGTELLTHLRLGKRHARGCWALDMVLAKTQPAA